MRPNSRLPGANASGVDVHEVGTWVVAHPASRQPERRVPDTRQRPRRAGGCRWPCPSMWRLYLATPVLWARNVEFVRGER